jgi:PAS domain S-box-containing protein
MARSTSIERQFPAMAALIVIVVSAAIALASYQQMQGQRRDIALARVSDATARFAGSLGTTATARKEQVDRAAASAAVQRILRGDTAARTAALAVLDSISPSGGQAHATSLWNSARSYVLSGAIIGDTSGWFGPPTAYQETRVSPVIALDDTTLYYEIIAPVRAGQTLLGWVQERHAVHPDPGVERGVELLFGRGSRILLGVPGGDWTDLQRRTDAPPREVTAGAVLLHDRADGVPVISAGRPVAGTPWVLVGERSLEAAMASSGGFLGRIVLIGIVIAGLGALAAWGLARGVTRPLAELTRAAEGIAGGDYGRRAQVTVSSEVGRLGRSFNRMADEIQGRLTAVRASESRFRSLVTASAQIVWSADANGDVVEPLSTWQTYTGQSFDDVKGRGWENAVHPEDRDGVRTTWQRAIDRRSGFVKEFRLRRHDGEYRHVVSRGMPVLEDDGRIREWVGTCSDVTEQKRAEKLLRQKDEELRQSQKMEAVGRLAGGIAHDFNNLLTAILGPAEMARDQIPTDHPARRELEDIRNAAIRASELTRQLLTFGRQQVLKPESIDLNDVLRDSGRLLGRLVGERIDLRVSLAPEPCVVVADRSQLEQIILNLVVNSRDAMPDGGRLTLETTAVDLGREFVERHSNVQPGAYTQLAITDTGLGMDEHTATHAFEPFFTTKEQGSGTGLGLATVYGIVHQSGGHIWVYTELGKGTTFKVYLPRVFPDGEAAEPVTEAGFASTRVRGTETVLLAEDDDVIRALTVRLLTRSGYSVLPANRGEAALEISRHHPGDIQLLVTDVVMPGMSGVDLWQQLREERPSCRVLFLSGWASDAIVQHGIIDSSTPFLQKPFTAEALIRHVRQVLDQG